MTGRLVSMHNMRRLNFILAEAACIGRNMLIYDASYDTAYQHAAKIVPSGDQPGRVDPRILALNQRANNQNVISGDVHQG